MTQKEIDMVHDHILIDLIKDVEVVDIITAKTKSPKASDPKFITTLRCKTLRTKDHIHVRQFNSLKILRDLKKLEKYKHVLPEEDPNKYKERF
jgi:hypothetical protein